MVPSMVNDLYIIRFAVCAKYATDNDMHIAFCLIQEHADIVIAEYYAQRSGQQSSSIDSLETNSKQTANTNLQQETENEEIVLETSTIYPKTKVRVK